MRDFWKSYGLPWLVGAAVILGIVAILTLFVWLVMYYPALFFLPIIFVIMSSMCVNIGRDIVDYYKRRYK